MVCKAKLYQTDRPLSLETVLLALAHEQYPCVEPTRPGGHEKRDVRKKKIAQRDVSIRDSIAHTGELK